MSATYSTYKIPGVKLASGRDAYGSKEMVVWLPLFIEYMWVVHGIRLIIIKVRDASATAASASTHLGGWAVDVRSWNLTSEDRNTTIYEATRLGLPIHYRIPSQGFSAHLHGMLDVGYWTPCKYQIDATEAGYSGLGAGGRKGKDLDAKHRPHINQWYGQSEGVSIMRARIGAALNPKEEDMPLSEADAKLIAKHVWGQMGTSGGPKSMQLMVAQSRNYDEAQSTALAKIASSLSSLSRKVGATEVDEQAIVTGVVTSLSGVIHDAVVKSIQEALRDIDSAEADEIAEAVVAELNERLAS